MVDSYLVLVWMGSCRTLYIKHYRGGVVEAPSSFEYGTQPCIQHNTLVLAVTGVLAGASPGRIVHAVLVPLFLRGDFFLFG